MVIHNPKNVKNGVSEIITIEVKGKSLCGFWSELTEKMLAQEEQKGKKSDYFVWHGYAGFRWTSLAAIRMFVKARALGAGFVLGSGGAQISWQEDAELRAAGSRVSIQESN